MIKHEPYPHGYFEAHCIAGGAFDHEDQDVDEDALEQKIRRHYEGTDGCAVEVYIRHHPHPRYLEDGEECSCGQFEISSHPTFTIPANEAGEEGTT